MKSYKERCRGLFTEFFVVDILVSFVCTEMRNCAHSIRCPNCLGEKSWLYTCTS